MCKKRGDGGGASAKPAAMAVAILMERISVRAQRRRRAVRSM